MKTKCNECNEIREFVVVNSIVTPSGEIIYLIYHCVECGHEVKMKPVK